MTKQEKIIVKTARQITIERLARDLLKKIKNSSRSVKEKR